MRCEALDADAGTDAVVMVGEIGGAMEEEAAEYARTMTKPVVAFIAGAAAPPGKKMGHAGAIVTGNAGSYAGKRKALEAAGVVVVDTPSQIAAAVAAGLDAAARPAKQPPAGIKDIRVTADRSASRAAIARQRDRYRARRRAVGGGRRAPLISPRLMSPAPCRSRPWCWRW